MVVALSSGVLQRERVVVSDHYMLHINADINILQGFISTNDLKVKQVD